MTGIHGQSCSPFAPPGPVPTPSMTSCRLGAVVLGSFADLPRMGASARKDLAREIRNLG